MGGEGRVGEVYLGQCSCLTGSLSASGSLCESGESASMSVRHIPLTRCCWWPSPPPPPISPRPHTSHPVPPALPHSATCPMGPTMWCVTCGVCCCVHDEVKICVFCSHWGCVGRLVPLSRQVRGAYVNSPSPPPLPSPPPAGTTMPPAAPCPPPPPPAPSSSPRSGQGGPAQRSQRTSPHSSGCPWCLGQPWLQR